MVFSFDNIYIYIAVAVPLFAIAGLGYWKQNLILYCNHTPPGSRGSYVYLPSRYNLLFEDVWMRTKDGVRIHAWLIRGPKKSKQLHQYRQSLRNKDSGSGGSLSSNSSVSSTGSAASSSSSSSSSSASIQEQMESFNTPTMIFFHGNAGNISHRLLNVSEMYRAGLECNVFLVEYRGYGLSEGEPTEEGLMLDAECALEYIRSRSDINTQKLFLFGRSLGGAVSIRLFQQYSHLLRGMIVENTFLSIPKMIDFLFPALRYVKFLSCNKWPSEEHIQHIAKDAPILFLAGGADEIVPHEHMQELYRLCSSKLKDMVVFPKGKHNETWLQPNYHEAIISFIEKYK